MPESGAVNVHVAVPGAATVSRPLCAFIVLSSACIITLDACSHPGPLRVSFSQSAPTVEAYDFVEVTANITWPRARHPFTEARLAGWFESADGKRRWFTDGFCD